MASYVEFIYTPRARKSTHCTQQISSDHLNYW